MRPDRGARANHLSLLTDDRLPTHSVPGNALASKSQPKPSWSRAGVNSSYPLQLMRQTRRRSDPEADILEG
jgi:hypothetical protein